MGAHGGIGLNLPNGNTSAWVRWATLIFFLGVSWATVKNDIRNGDRDREQDARIQASAWQEQKEFNDEVRDFMHGTQDRNENQAGWYERVVQLEHEVDLLRERQASAPARHYTPPEPRPRPTVIRSTPTKSEDPRPRWQRDPRRNPQ